MKNNSKTPNTLCCPLTGKLMKNPVIDQEGNSYEHDAIMKWLDTNSTSPVTNNPLDAGKLIPNNALKASATNFINSLGNNSLALPIQVDGLKVEVVQKNGNSLISIVPPEKIEGVDRMPVDLCCVIDISASMDCEAKIKTGDNSSEGYVFSTLDLVKHAVRTMFNSLDERDRFSLVTFNNHAMIELDLTEMNEGGKRKAELVIESIKASNSTNLWGGLHEGLEILRTRSLNRNSSIFLLTDGQPNVIPPRGHIPMIKKYKEQNGLPAIINTFGFGYELDSKLLVDIAKEGRGTYGFIPDGSMVGTIFVNALSNLLSTIATNINLTISLGGNKLKDEKLIENYEHIKNDKSLQLKIGSITMGQPINFVLPIVYPNQRRLLAVLTYDTPYSNNTRQSFDIEVKEVDDTLPEIHNDRLTFVNNITKAMALVERYQIPHGLVAVQNTIDEIKSSVVSNDPYIKDLLQDLEGQVTLAFSRQDYYNKWGQHYLPSLIRAHLLQQCNNFKDPGVQHFGGKLFTEIRDMLDDIFLKLPPPTASIQYTGYSSAHINVSNMGGFHNSSHPCFDGNCLVTMADKSTKMIKNIKKNDQILGSDGLAVKVECVVETKCLNNKADFVEFKDGLKVTPWHPVKISGRFFFPATLGEVKEFDCPAVYNFVLERNHIMTINGVECVTLAHGFQGDVVKHPYFGSSVIRSDLQKIRGWNRGLVRITPSYIVRNADTGMIDSIRKPSFLSNFNFRIFTMKLFKFSPSSFLNNMNKFKLNRFNLRFISRIIIPK